MNPQISSALIAAIASTITAIASIVLGKACDSEPSIKQIYKEQLINLFEPMDKLLSFSKASTPDLLLSDICQLVDSYYRFVPISVLKEIERLKHIDMIEFADFDKLQIIVASFYNWLKRKFSYPYDKSKIICDFTPRKDNKKISIYASYAVLFGIASGVIATVSLLIVVFRLLNDYCHLSFPYFVLGIVFLVSIPYIRTLFDAIIEWLYGAK